MRRHQSLRLTTMGVMRGLLALTAIVLPSMAWTQVPSPPATQASPSVPTLTRAQVDALLGKPGSVLVIDVRRADEISTIGGFPVFLNVQNADLAGSLAFVPRDRTIITVSNHAHRAIAAANVLTAQGYRVAGAVGAQDYEAQGGKLVGRKPLAAAGAPKAAADGPPANASKSGAEVPR